MDAPQMTPFFGRQAELVEIARLLDDPDCRLLTLVGPGGIGKTRLALEAARTAHYADGVYDVLLQPLSSSTLIVTAIVDRLPFSLFGNADPKSQLLDYLHRKHLLLVLDNFEHLIDGAVLLTDILEQAPSVKLLVTSRERLQLRPEWVFDVGGLEIPKDDQLSVLENSSAAQLFLESARRTGSRLQAVEAVHVIRVCQLVEGNPLALELSASWIRTLPCAQIAREIETGLDILATTMRDFPERHRSMRAVFAQSLALCSASEQAVFPRLAVFQGGFGREAAEQVAGATLATLAALGDRSLLRVGPDGRYSLHELLRQFGTEQLGERSEEALSIRDRHCAYYARFMEAQWPRLTGSEIKAALTDIGLELNNVRAAWEWAVSQRKAAEVEAALRWLWFFYGVSADYTHYQQGAQVFADAASAFQENTALCGKLMARCGELEFVAGSFGKARSLLLESLRLLRPVGARYEIAFVLYRLVLVGLNFLETVPEAAEYLEESFRLYTELDDRYGMGEVLGIWGLYYQERFTKERQPDDLRRAQQYCQESLIVNQQQESLFGVANSHLRLAWVAVLGEDYASVLQHVQITRPIFWDLGIFWGVVQSLTQEGLAAYKLGDHALARRCVLELLPFILDRGPARNQQYGIQFYAPIILSNLHLAAAIVMEDGKQLRAYELLAVVDQQLRDVSFQPDPSTFFLLDRLQADLPATLAEAVRHGRGRDLESAIQDAIADLTTCSSPEPSATQRLGDRPSERETEIIRLITDGYNSRQVAERLFLSVNTVRWYLRQIYSKLDVHSRAELTERARTLHLLT